jgi:tRNA(Ile)-lysidine synthase
VPDNVEPKVAEFIRLHGLFAGAGPVVLAVSGGADSTALLHVLHSLQADGVISAGLVCAHVNHRLRGSASDEDERFVVEQASRLRLPVVTRAVDVRACAKAGRLSVETAARRLRLSALAEIAGSCGATWIATGHQKNDNAETVIQRLRRGTGFRGLAGIRPARRFGEGTWFASPLLDVARDEIVAYLDRRRLKWREDHTNVDPAYTRNYIRHRLLPALQQDAHGSLIEELAGLAASASRLYDRIQQAAEEATSRLAEQSDDATAIAAPGLASLPELVAVELIRQNLAKLGGEQDVTQDHYRRILQLAHGPAGAKAVSLPGGSVARRERERVILAGATRPPSGIQAPQMSTSIQVPGETTWGRYRIEARILSRNDVEIRQIKGDKNPFRQYFDCDRVGQPIVVRSRRAGDRLRPLGMAGEKKLGKFLTTARVPREVRENIAVFADPEKIFWVCPVRIAEPAKITEQTRRILVLNVVDDREGL